MGARAVRTVKAAKKPPGRRAAAELTDSKLHFLITETLFTVEARGEFAPESEVMHYWYAKFREDRVRALYNLGFEEKPDAYCHDGNAYRKRSFQPLVTV